MTTNYMSNYTYGTNAYDEIPEVAKPYGIKKVVFIGGKRALAAAEPKARKALEGSGIEVTGSFVYGVDSTQTNIDRLVATPEVQEADAVFGFGGGKALDRWLPMNLTKSSSHFRQFVQTVLPARQLRLSITMTDHLIAMAFQKQPSIFSLIRTSLPRPRLNTSGQESVML